MHALLREPLPNDAEDRRPEYSGAPQNSSCQASRATTQGFNRALLHAILRRPYKKGQAMKIKHILYKRCICFQCSGNRSNHSPDCACDNGPIYDVEACAFCPKRGFCDVAKNPWDYKPEELRAQGIYVY